MSRWFRFYAEALDDPKVQRLSPHLFKAWVNLLCVAAHDNGALPSNDDIAFRLRLSCQDAESITSDLTLAGLIDITPNGGRVMHNWAGRQYASDSSAERVRKHREKKKKQAPPEDGNGACNVSVTVQSRAEQNRTEDSATPLPPDVVSAPSARRQQDLKIDFGSGQGRGPAKGVGGATGWAVGGAKGRDAAERATSIREHTLQRAEQFGLPVDEIVAEARDANPANLDAYVQAICRTRLRRQIPRISDDVLRAAFGRSPGAYTQVLALLSMTP